MQRGLEDVDIVMMLRLQTERMQGSFVPSVAEYFHFYGLTYDKLRAARPDALIMHPGPMNRGVEIDGVVADDIDRSAILDQVEMGVAVRMAVLDLLTQHLRVACRVSRPVVGRQRAPARPRIRARRARGPADRRRPDRRGRPGVTVALAPGGAEVIDAKGLCLAPGLVDMRVQLGEPGAEHKERIDSGVAAAAAGGVTSMAVLPNTDPPIDDACNGRVPGPPGAAGEARQGLPLRRHHQAAGRPGADRDRPAQGGRCASPSPTASGRSPMPG